MSNIKKSKRVIICIGGCQNSYPKAMMILTTVGLDFEISCPSVTVSVLLDPKDIEEVRRALKE